MRELHQRSCSHYQAGSSQTFLRPLTLLPCGLHRHRLPGCIARRPGDWYDPRGGHHALLPSLRAAYKREGYTARGPGPPSRTVRSPGPREAITRRARGQASDDDAENEEDTDAKPPNLASVWALVVLSIAYLHHSTTGFALPAMLPLITPDLKLDDNQSALLTVGYTVLYALALIPVGFLADKVDRPRLLSGGLATWSVLTMAASKVGTFGGLLATRIGFAAAQATQNPICFSLIPELFPKRRNLAMSAYNSAIYAGRALSFTAVLIASKLSTTSGDTPPNTDIGVSLVPIDSLDLSLVSILYTQGDQAAIVPNYNYNFQILHDTITISSWRQLLYWLGPPGLVIALMALFTVAEPRKKATGPASAPPPAATATQPARDMPRRHKQRTAAAVKSADHVYVPDAGLMPPHSLSPSMQQVDLAAQKAEERQGMMDSVKALLSSRAFQALTAAAAINDVGSWALVSWQATFYQRVYEVGPETYAPALAILLPIGGLLGGVGGGLLADKLSKQKRTALLTSGATMAAAPVLACNMLAPDLKTSLAFLVVGFALSEMWRAPAAVLIRDVSPPSLGSTGSAVHLCIRNLIGGLGPLAVANLAHRDGVGLQKAMLIVPLCFLLSGIGFFFADKALEADKREGELPPGSPASLESADF
ncbi:hypothetical protein WJX73_004887 [Symbiochloris irregularis]|uniref:Major facilitator superfamily (MFS) profile domain-containing protein n=1 Tax=Symbiochloris irregularis TaxID=706552 RepID=A0AAW1PMI2_9CHLO